MSSKRRAPCVFVSYLWNAPREVAWVLNLSTDLRARGVDVSLYEWDALPGADISHFTEKGVRDSDRVLVVCSEDYVRKANRRQGFEHSILSAELIRKEGLSKFIPLIRQRRDQVELPAALSSRTYIDFRDDQLYTENLDRLIHELHNVRCRQNPPLGSDARREQYVDEAFKLITRRFERGVRDLEKADKRISAVFTRMGARGFAAIISEAGEVISRCGVRANMECGSVGPAVTFSTDLREAGRTFNEILMAESEGTELFLRPLGMVNREMGGQRLTAEQGAELYWSVLIAPLVV